MVNASPELMESLKAAYGEENVKAVAGTIPQSKGRRY
jgi:hypothetical protein